MEKNGGTDSDTQGRKDEGKERERQEEKKGKKE